MNIRFNPSLKHAALSLHPEGQPPASEGPPGCATPGCPGSRGIWSRPDDGDGGDDDEGGDDGPEAFALPVLPGSVSPERSEWTNTL